MKIDLKSPEEIKKMRLGGEIASRILRKITSEVRAGVSTGKLDDMAEKMILEAGAKPSFKGFAGYPKSLCVSINDEVVHGIPKDRILKDGEIVGLDLGVYFEGFHSDTAVTVSVGKITKEDKHLIDVTRKALYEGIKRARAGKFLGDIQSVIQKTVEKEGFSLIRDLAGHGVGRELQEAPSILNFGKPGTGIKLEEGMTLAIEPMTSAGDWHVKVLEDGWTIITTDGSHSAHFEHSIAITKNGPIILTE